MQLISCSTVVVRGTVRCVRIIWTGWLLYLSRCLCCHGKVEKLMGSNSGALDLLFNACFALFC